MPAHPSATAGLRIQGRFEKPTAHFGSTLVGQSSTAPQRHHDVDLILFFRNAQLRVLLTGADRNDRISALGTYTHMLEVQAYTGKENNTEREAAGNSVQEATDRSVAARKLVATHKLVATRRLAATRRLVATRTSEEPETTVNSCIA